MKYFQGDGREMMEPTDVYPGTKPMSVRRAAANRVVYSFLTSGYSNHTSAGSTLWIIRRYCREARIPYTMRVIPGAGFQVKLLSACVQNKSLEKQHSYQSQHAHTH